MYTELEKSYLAKSFQAIAQSTDGDIVDEVFLKCDQVAKRVSPSNLCLLFDSIGAEHLRSPSDSGNFRPNSHETFS